MLKETEQTKINGHGIFQWLGLIPPNPSVTCLPFMFVCEHSYWKVLIQHPFSQNLKQVTRNECLVLQDLVFDQLLSSDWTMNNDKWIGGEEVWGEDRERLFERKGEVGIILVLCSILYTIFYTIWGEDRERLFDRKGESWDNPCTIFSFPGGVGRGTWRG